MKVFKTYRQQLGILRKRGLLVPTNGLAMRDLENENYYKIINGYKSLFIDPAITATEKFRNSSTFSEIKALYDFDRALRLIFLKHILAVESKLKSSIAYEFSKVNGHDNYLRKSSFDDLKASGAKSEVITSRNQDISNLISNIQTVVSQSCERKDYVKHYLLEYGYVPLWVLINVMTLGTVSKFYRLMKQSEKVAVSKRFNIGNSTLDQYIKVLGVIRNITAHEERLYNIRLNRGYEIPDSIIHATLLIPKKNGKYAKGKIDLFSVLIILKELLPKKDFQSLCREINLNIVKLAKSIHSITESDVLGEMGFPFNWGQISKI